jgi:hypothetical protein
VIVWLLPNVYVTVPVAAGAASSNLEKVFAPVTEPPPLSLTILYVYPAPAKSTALIVEVPAVIVCPAVAVNVVPTFIVELPRVNVPDLGSKVPVVVTVLFAVVKLLER